MTGLPPGGGSPLPSGYAPFKEETLANLLSHHLSKLYLSITEKCNLRCTYCPHTTVPQGFRSHTSAEMSERDVTNAFDFITGRSAPGKAVMVNFFGGEPLLRPDLIELVISHAGERHPGLRVVFSVTTNGTLLSRRFKGTESILDFLVRRGVALRLSFDGAPDYQDRTRRHPDGTGTGDEIAAILEMLSRYPEYRRQKVLLKIAETSSEHRLANIAFLESLSTSLEGARVSVVGVIEYGDWEKPTQERAGEGERLLWSMYFKHPSLLGETTRAYLDGVIRRIRPALERLEKPDACPRSERILPAGFCLPGVGAVLADPAGILRPCFRTEPFGAIGSVEDGIDVRAVASWVERLRSAVARSDLDCQECLWESDCRRCWADLIAPDGRIDLARFASSCQAERSRLARNEALAIFIREHAPAVADSLKREGRAVLAGSRASCSE